MAQVSTVAVIGAGTMGRGIAHVAALGGYRTILEDLLPNALRIWMELKQPQADREKIMRLNRYNIWLSGGQGVMQVAMILIMAHFRF